MPLLTIFLAWLVGIDDVRSETRKYASYPPMRPLPIASSRPRADGPALFVDGKQGRDSSPGTEASPWKTIQHAVTQLKPGDTLYIRGGTYYEHVTVRKSGSAERPITIRSYPFELVVLDGGLREFFENPSDAWERCPGGAEGEYWSVKTYPDLGGSPGGVNVLGNFGDSMVPLHGYRVLGDLRDSSLYWDITDKMDATQTVYCGPGIYFDTVTDRIHVRLAHTDLPGLYDENYRGETDPRKLPLVIAGIQGGPALTLQSVQHVRVQDIVVRGATSSTLLVDDCANITLEGVTAYSARFPISVRNTSGLRVLHTACRGLAAPWTFRSSLKYRSTESRLFSASGWNPGSNRDFEIAYSEFTDSVDGVFIGNVRRLWFNHNYVDNVSDDGFFLTATTALDGTTHGGEIYIYQNLLSRCLTTFAFGVGHGRQKALQVGRQTGAGVKIYRNVFDFRRTVMYYLPSGPDKPQELSSPARLTGDHGSPAWEPMDIYHNTIIANDPPTPYGTNGIAGPLNPGSPRRSFNNIFFQLRAVPGQTLPTLVRALPDADEIEEDVEEDPIDELIEDAGNKPKTEAVAVAEPQIDMAVLAAQSFQADGNLHWGFRHGKVVKDFLSSFRKSDSFKASKAFYKPGWTANDSYADPQFSNFEPDWKKQMNLALKPGSRAIDAGVILPEAWPDPIRSLDAGKPDAGALPAGLDPWRVGVGGRLSIFGEQLSPTEESLAYVPKPIEPHAADQKKRRVAKPALIITGYPALELPMLSYAIRRTGASSEISKQELRNSEAFGDYSMVLFTGDLVRGGVTSKFSEKDLQLIRGFIESGGVLLMMYRTLTVFDTPAGQDFLTALLGKPKRKTVNEFEVLMPEHPWVNHLDTSLVQHVVKVAGEMSASPANGLGEVTAEPPMVSKVVREAYLERRISQPIWAAEGERIIGSSTGATTLYRRRLGKGQFIYIGWPISTSLPHGRLASTLKKETIFEQQMTILIKMMAELHGPPD